MPSWRATIADRALVVSPRMSTLSGRTAVEDGFDADEDRRKQGGRGLAAGVEGMVRRSDAELREEHVPQVRLEVLPGVHDHVVALPVEDRDDPAQAG